MAIRREFARTGMDDSREEPVHVWDLPTRFFHWCLVVLVVAGMVTGYVSPEWWMGYHTWAGYGVVALIVFRIAWAAFGSEYSRIASFAYSPSDVIRHLRGVFILRPPHYIGHNPIGSIMIFVLMAALVVLSVSGLIELGGEENQGPLAGVVPYMVGDAAKDIHRILAIGLLAMVGVHVLGVVVEIWLTGDNLIGSMVHGRKKIPKGLPMPIFRRAKPWAAAATVGTFVVIGGSALAFLGRIPPSGLIQVAEHEAFELECSECHELYHPSLLPENSWRGLMATLDDHFGEDASLEKEITTSITRYLAEYASEKWDTEAANRFRTVADASPWQITATPYWRRKHGSVAGAAFDHPKVKRRSNCLACHSDATTGQFDDQNISLPKG